MEIIGNICRANDILSNPNLVYCLHRRSCIRNEKKPQLIHNTLYMKPIEGLAHNWFQ